MSTKDIVPFQNNYSLLRVKPDYDEEKVRQFAMAANERKILQSRLKELESLMKDNSDLVPWTITESSGRVVALPDMDEDELNKHLQIYPVNKYLVAESESRTSL